MDKADKIIFSVLGIIVILIFVFWKDVKSISQINSAPEKEEKQKKEKKEKSGDQKNTEEKTVNSVSEVSILGKWELPTDLKEVSGIAFIDENRFACIQDEKGAIFIFNTQSNKTEKEIPFAGAGDYEDIAIKGNMAYIIRADGKLFEVNMDAGKSTAKTYNSPLTVSHNVEGLCYDKNNERLLLAIKDDEPSKPGYKGIYAFDLSRKTFEKEPVFKIDLQNEALVGSQDKKNKSIMPSAIGIHPVTNEMFVTDGPKSKLLIMDKDGKITKLLDLGKDFSQPEGIAFSPAGDIFISNEGSKQPGNILKVGLK